METAFIKQNILNMIEVFCAISIQTLIIIITITVLNLNIIPKKQLNNTFSDNNNLSIFHLNIRSLPLHFSEFLCYLDTLDLEFKIIALSETGINNHHAVYNITHYNLEMDHRQKRRGGGVSLYIHNVIQYKIRKDLVIGDVVNSVFI